MNNTNQFTYTYRIVYIALNIIKIILKFSKADNS